MHLFYKGALSRYVFFTIIASMCILVFSNSLIAQDNKIEKNNPINISVAAIKVSPSIYELSVKIFVKSKDSIQMYESDLPWENDASLEIIAKSGLFHQLKERLRIDDPRPGTVELKRSQILSGNIKLNGRFPELSTAIKKHDITVKWRYLLKNTGGERLQTYSGSITIKKEQH